MNKIRMTFGLLAVVAVAGVMLAGIGPALANDPKFLTVRAAETVSLSAVSKVCNENYGQGTCPNHQGCDNKQTGFGDNQEYCTSNAYADCGPAGANLESGMTHICYCSWNECGGA